MSAASQRHRLAVVVLNYRTPDLVIECLESLEGEVVVGKDVVVVVDNASGDDSRSRIGAALEQRGWSAWARLVCSDVNGGFSAGNNVGIRAADADAYLLLNSDTLVRPGAIEALLAGMASRPGLGMVSPRLEGVDEEPQISCFRFHSPLSELIRGAATGPIDSALKSFVVPQPLDDSPAEHQWTSFAAVMINRDALQATGLLDDGYFMYFEDTDYCRRLGAAGWKILHWPAARVVHKRGGSGEVKAKLAAKERPPRYFYESRARYFLKFYGRLGYLCANLLWTLGAVIAELRSLFPGRARVRCRGELLDVWTATFCPAPDARSRRCS